mmetsp:Transcript_13215/g.31368  ORF Transcript_13215/g.31368 Transcript_13215/m.31368 type:complete len:356 (-) Transcript_13215:763-1830(-)
MVDKRHDRGVRALDEEHEGAARVFDDDGGALAVVVERVHVQDRVRHVRPPSHRPVRHLDNDLLHNALAEEKAAVTRRRYKRPLIWRLCLVQGQLRILPVLHLDAVVDSEVDEKLAQHRSALLLLPLAKKQPFVYELEPLVEARGRHRVVGQQLALAAGNRALHLAVPAPVLDPSHRAFLELHEILRQRAGLVRKDVIDLAQFFAEPRRPRLGGDALLTRVHLEVGRDDERRDGLDELDGDVEGDGDEEREEDEEGEEGKEGSLVRGAGVEGRGRRVRREVPGLLHGVGPLHYGRPDRPNQAEDEEEEEEAADVAVELALDVGGLVRRVRHVHLDLGVRPRVHRNADHPLGVFELG